MGTFVKNQQGERIELYERMLQGVLEDVMCGHDHAGLIQRCIPDIRVAPFLWPISTSQQQHAVGRKATLKLATLLTAEFDARGEKPHSLQRHLHQLCKACNTQDEYKPSLEGIDPIRT